MGKSVKWRVPTSAGERIVRVQSAFHTGRIRLFVDEALVWNREDGYALWDQELLHEFDLDGLKCQLELQFARPRLFVDGQEVEKSR